MKATRKPEPEPLTKDERKELDDLSLAAVCAREHYMDESKRLRGDVKDAERRLETIQTFGTKRGVELAERQLERARCDLRAHRRRHLR